MAKGDTAEECVIEEQTKEITQLKADLAKIQTLVDTQAKDEGLWFKAQTAPEGYLQRELRRLHAAIEQAKERWE